MFLASEDLQTRWWQLLSKLQSHFGKKPDIEGILFLIGIQETSIHKKKYSKEEKQDLMHVAICTLLQPSGYYIFDYQDKDGWPHFKQLKQLPALHLPDQENFLKDHILFYFSNQEF
jgi:hypothetical protein